MLKSAVLVTFLLTYYRHNLINSTINLITTLVVVNKYGNQHMKRLVYVVCGVGT